MKAGNDERAVRPGVVLVGLLPLLFLGVVWGPARDVPQDETAQSTGESPPGPAEDAPPEEDPVEEDPVGAQEDSGAQGAEADPDDAQAGKTPGDAQAGAPGPAVEPAEADVPATPATPGGEATSPSLAPRYHALADKDALVSAWLGSGRAELLELGRSAGGRELFGVQFGGRGPTPLADRTTILLLGGLDGVSTSGSEAVLALTDVLLSRPEELPAEATFVSIPWANPDGLAKWLESSCGDGRNDTRADEDKDGEYDEDGPDDVDGDGEVLEMLLEDPAGSWTLSASERFPRIAREGEAPRYRRVREGRDDDGDGLYNEDPPGGVNLDANFPVGWSGSWSGVASGRWPLSESASRALAEFALSRRTALLLVFQGNHGQLATPGGVLALPAVEGGRTLPFEADEPVYQDLVARFARATGRLQSRAPTLSEARGAPRPGSAVDWAYTALGALAMEVAVWGPEVESGMRETVDASFVAKDKGTFGAEDAWGRWLDDTRGGLGFVDWHPVDLGDGVRGLVGGWQPLTRHNPPVEVLEVSQRGLDLFALDLAKSLPRLEVEVLETRRNGRVCHVQARVRNQGALPSGAGPNGPELEATLRLELPEGASLLAGEWVNRLGHLPGQGTSATFDWLLVAPDDTRLFLTVQSAWCPPVEEEVRL